MNFRARLHKLEQRIRASTRLEQLCREKTRQIVEGTEARRADGLTFEEMAFAPELFDNPLKQWSLSEIITLHDRVRAGFGLAPTGAFP